jgi:hypothetical protein
MKMIAASLSRPGATTRLSTNGNADASGQTVHPQSRPRQSFLILDVGNSGRDPLPAHAGDSKIICDRVRPLTAFGHFLER